MIHFQTPLYHIFYLFKPWYNQLANNIHLYPHPPYPSCSCYMYQKIEKKYISKRNITYYGKLQNVQNFSSDTRLSVN